MIEKTFVKRSGPKYWGFIILLIAIIAIGFAAYIYQMSQGFQVTGMSRDISWGLYIGHLTFFVGVAAGGVMIVLPYYFHDAKAYGRITVVGEFLAIAAILMALLFVVVDVGSPQKLFNVYLYWTPKSMLCWDSVVLPTYLILNIVVGYQVLQAENKGLHYKKWVRNLGMLSVPVAFSIHIVTACLYSGLPSRDYFLSAVLPAKFLAGAFATGPALIILICMLMKKLTGFDAGEKAIKMLSTTAIYSYIVVMIMMFGELFTAYYSNVEGHKVALDYLFFGLHGHDGFVPLMRIFVVTVILTLVLLVPTKLRYNKTTQALGCVALFISMYIEKGLTFVIGGLSESPFGEIVDYHPTLIEITVIVAIFAIGILVLSLLLKMVAVVKYDNDEGAFPNKPDRTRLAYRLNEEAGTYVDTRPQPEPEESEEAEATPEGV